MDPRPYHYEYRRPRLNNPTFHSINLYQSLYHRGIRDRYEAANNVSSYFSNNYVQNQSYPNEGRKNSRHRDYVEKYIPGMVQKDMIQRQKKQSLKNNMSNSVMLDSMNPEYMRPSSNRSNQSNDGNLKQQRPSILASYGKNSMNHNNSYVEERNYSQQMTSSTGAYDRLNQCSIYQKQQKPYSIVGNYPRSTSTQLKKYPKLTLQNKLIEEGRYAPY